MEIVSPSLACKDSVYQSSRAKRGDLIPVLLNCPSLGTSKYLGIAAPSLARKDFLLHIFHGIVFEG